MQVERKIFEVDTIICRRQHCGKVQYLVTWKGFGYSSATWEPVENLVSCADLIAQFQRQTSPIPGANPFILEHSGKTKKVHVKMLLTRKGGHKRTKSMAAYNEHVDTTCQTETLNGSEPLTFKKKHNITESEKLIRDTLIHESKTMERKKTNYNKINDIINNFDMNLSPNGLIQKRSLNRNSQSHSIYDKNLVLSSVQNGYLQITLNNVDRNNLITPNMLAIICECLHRACKNPDVKAVLICSNGDYFCSGIDYSELVNSSDDKEYKSNASKLVVAIKSLLAELLLFPKPIVCAVNGPALELGVAIVAASDFAYGTSKTCFDLLYCKLGLSPVGYLSKLLPKIVGNSMALSMLYMGKRYNAVTAYDRGLISDIFGLNSFQEDISKCMANLTVVSMQALISTKKLLNHFDISRIEEICGEELNCYHALILTKECKSKIKEEWPSLVSLPKEDI
ncbi:chromodomain Y-like protein 2 [Hydra vulgaris]|uniref:chromodomain Y-like protein 2 n=1 Tax=Hydra vulgaris TaxID=6087 RepID=UPI0001927395|nr:chromodomain Y-like protein 2 [Hydra vulgaris]